VARELGDQWRLSQILAWQSCAATLAGNTVATAAAGEEGYVIADAVGDQFMSRMSRFWGVAIANFQRGKVARAVEVLRDLRAEADAVGDLTHGLMCRIALAHTLTSLGKIAEARGQANEAVEAAAGLGPFIEIWAYAPVAQAALAAGDLSAAVEASNVAWERTMAQPELAIANVTPMAELAFVRGDLTEAKKLMDEAVAAMAGWHLTKALITRAHVAVALSDLAQAERDSREALSVAAGVQAYQVVPDALEILAEIGCAAGDHREAARFAGAADGMRRLQGGTVRLAIYEPAYAAAISTLRGALGEQDFEPAWAEGAALSLEEAIAYAQRGHGERKRPSSGWESLTPTELDVVRLVSEGLGNKDIATRLFISHRTVQTHLTHVYAKLGITSRVQLAQQAARQA
jgi:DNA-binding CsgD family transcriptional regulator